MSLATSSRFNRPCIARERQPNDVHLSLPSSLLLPSRKIKQVLAEATSQGREKSIEDIIDNFPLFAERPAALVQELLRAAVSAESGKTRRYAYFLIQDAVSKGISGAPQPFRTAEEGYRPSLMQPQEHAAAAKMIIEKLTPRWELFVCFHFYFYGK